MALPFRALTPPTHIFFFSLHLSCVGLPAAVHLSEAAPADDPMHAEIVHGQLQEQRGEKEFQIINNNAAWHGKEKAFVARRVIQASVNIVLSMIAHTKNFWKALKSCLDL